MHQRQMGGPAQDQAEHDDDHHPEQRLAELAHHLCGDDRQTVDRHRAETVDHSLGDVVGGRHAGADRVEGEGLADDAWEQIVLVIDARDVDRRSEHVQEKQNEDDRLDRHIEQALGDPRDRTQAASGQQGGVAYEADRAAEAGIGNGGGADTHAATSWGS